MTRESPDRMRQALRLAELLCARLCTEPGMAAAHADLIRVEGEIGGMRAGLAKAHAFAIEDPGNPLYDVISAQPAAASAAHS